MATINVRLGALIAHRRAARIAVILFVPTAALLIGGYGSSAAVTGLPTTIKSTTADDEWLLEGRDTDNTHFSPLTGINDKNVTQLGLAWVAELPTGDGSVGTPLVADGVIYQSATFSRVIANDVRTGKLRWDFRPELRWSGDLERHFGIVNRGVALWKDKVYVNGGDCRLRAIERNTGKLAWEADVCTENPHLTLTAMPHVGAGKVFVGTSNNDFGTSRCHISAFDAETGKRAWRFYTIPGDRAEDTASADPEAMILAAKTWGKGYAPAGGCAWNSANYDPTLNLLFVGTGGPAPFTLPDRGTDRGDELFSNAILALNPDTGKYVWHFQVTHDDIANYEAVETITLADVKLNDESRRVILQAPKNGFFFVLDAKTGQFISAKNYVPVNWTDGIDSSTGRAAWRSETRYWAVPARRFTLLPSGMGAHNFQPMAYSPRTGLAYIPAIEMPQDYVMIAGPTSYGGINMNLSIHADIARTPLIAWDPVAQRERWRVNHPMPINSGVLATAGNLIFQGLGTGEIEAYRADTGERLWSYQTHAAVAATPITVKVDGRQFLLVYVGNGGSTMIFRGWRALWNAPVRDATPRLLAFEIGGKAMLPPVPPVPPVLKPIVPPPSATSIGQGALLFELNCSACHGQQTLAIRGVVPDLRRSLIPAMPDAFKNVVIGGDRVARGMPKFPLKPEELEQLRAYIIHQTWASYDAAQQGTELGPNWR